MKTSTELQSELDAIRFDLAPLQKRERELTMAVHRAKSLEFIAANGITRADVESPDGHEYFGTVWKFADWLRANSTKNWAEWNTTIYRTSDLINGRMPDMPARVGDLT